MNSNKHLAGSALLVDMGNTNLKWCWFKAGARSPLERASHVSSSVSAIAEQNWRPGGMPGRVLVSNVTGMGVEVALSEWAAAAWGVRPEFIRSERKAGGVTNGYTDPGQLGVDRWLTLIAVFNQEKRSACVVDSGTATTVDVIDGAGKHLGGLILPGFDLMRESLLERTHIPRVGRTDPELLLARDTATAIASAAVHATASLVEHTMRSMRDQLGQRLRLVLTGSNAEHIGAALDEPYEVDPELIIKGLAVLAEERTG